MGRSPAVPDASTSAEASSVAIESNSGALRPTIRLNGNTGAKGVRAAIIDSMINNVIDLKSRRRRHLEQDALAYHRQRQAELFQPPHHYIEQLRFRLRRRLGINVDMLRNRGEWESAVDDLFRLEMADLLGQRGTPSELPESELPDLFPEFDEQWRD